MRTGITLGLSCAAAVAAACGGGLSHSPVRWLPRRLAQREGATIFMVLLAGLAALLHRYTGQTDLVIGTPVANTRVFVPRRVEVIPGSEQRLQRMTDGGWDPRQSLFLESSSANPVDSIDGTANIVIDEPMRLQIEARMQTPVAG